MRISIFGLGYVGAVSSGCLANDGHQVIGVDPVRTKVDLINEGQSPIIEKDIGDIIRKTAESGMLLAVTDPALAVAKTELSFICVGTPSQPNGNLDLEYVRRVCEEIGKAIRNKTESHTVVVRSTMLPGSTRDVVIPALEKHSGKKSGKDFLVCYNPEFLREGTAVQDFYDPPKTVIGETQPKGGDLLALVYKAIEAPLIRTDLETAELVKYVDNAWHAMKIGFANEIGNLAKAMDVDGHRVMDIFLQDTKLNISKAYLKPGFAFGGSCLPKDLRALTRKAQSLDLSLPLLGAVLPSNELQIEHAFKMITARGNKKVGVLGFSFKAGTDDLRESPMVELVERLIGKGYDIALYDRNVSLATLVGANKDYILNLIPHISKLIVSSIDELLEHSETIVIGNGDPEFRNVIDRIRPHQSMIDLVRITDKEMPDNYEGICW